MGGTVTPLPHTPSWNQLNSLSTATTLLNFYTERGTSQSTLNTFTTVTFSGHDGLDV
jgi:hypothetical protein